jgi:nucleotide-binding universal stress UspA family protein
MRVVVALDGSKFGENAAAAIAPWAREAGASVVLMTVRHPADFHGTWAALSPATGEPAGYVRALPGGTITTPLIAMGERLPVVAEDRTQALERARVETEEYLDGIVERYFKGVAAEVSVQWSEQTAEAIAHCAEEKDADLIAMGTHGRSGLKHALLGSVAEAVVRTSPVPVFLARDGMRLARAGERMSGAGGVIPS